MKEITDIINSRNKQLDLMRAIGILFVVWGHNYQPPFLFFPAFYFHMSLFFFISGYFFKPQVIIVDKIKYFVKKTRKLLLPYFVFNLFFGLLTMWLRPIGINLGGDLNFENLFIAPFGRGDQFALYLAAWFLFNLYLISIFAGLVYQKNIKINIGIIVLAFILMLVFLDIGNHPGNSMWMIFLSRSIFGFCFFSLGYLFHFFESRIYKFIIHPVNVVILYLIVNVLNAYFGNIWYSILFGNVSNNLVIVPVVTSLCIILLVYVLTFYIKKIINKNSFFYEIGEDSYAIMVLHLLLFFMVNVILYKLYLIPYAALSDVYYRYQIEKTWLIYQIPAIIVPILIVRSYRRVRKIVLAPAVTTSLPIQQVPPTVSTSSINDITQ